MINERIGLVEVLVVLTFSDHVFISSGQNKTGISPGIANKKGTLLWGDRFYFNLLPVTESFTFSSILSLKSSLSLFLAKIYNKEVKKFG